MNVFLLLNYRTLSLRNFSIKRCFYRTFAFVAILFLISMGTATAQESSAPNQVTDEKDGVSLNLENVDLNAFVDTVSSITGKSFIVDPRVKGKVSIISGGTLNREQLYEVFLSVLEVHNAAAVESGSITKIVPKAVAKQKPIPTQFTETIDIAQADKSTDDQQITQIIHLEHVDVQTLVPIIRPLIPPTSHFAPHLQSNSIVVTDTAANIQRILEIIHNIDVPDKKANIYVIYLEHAKASNITANIQGLFEKTGEAGSKSTQSNAMNVQAISSINALVVNATDEVYQQILSLVTELDIERDLNSDVNVIYLKHAKAPDLVSILNESSGAEKDGVKDFSVQADEATNSLIVKASSRQLKSIQSVVEKLDIPRKQVFVEAVIAEVSIDQTTNLGLEWRVGSNEEPLNIISDNGQREGKVTSGTNFGLSTTGFNYSLLDFGRFDLDVVVNALRADDNTNVLSTPTILTLDNEEAEIVVGQEVPFITGRFDNNNNNNNNNQFQTIERKDVGLKLKIKPQISDDNTIRLEVSQEISNVVTTSIQGQADLITNRRSIDTVVLIDDGQVIVLGGLIQNDYTDTEEWVPILGKIPLIGYLFRNKTKSAVKRNLMVFLKPRIIRSPEELVNFSRNKYDQLRSDSLQLKKKTDKDLLFRGGGGQPNLKEYDELKGENDLMIEDEKNRKTRQSIKSFLKTKKEKSAKNDK